MASPGPGFIHEKFDESSGWRGFRLQAKVGDSVTCGYAWNLQIKVGTTVVERMFWSAVISARDLDGD